MGGCAGDQKALQQSELQEAKRAAGGEFIDSHL